MPFSDVTPKLGDSDNDLLQKIAQSLGAERTAGDSANDLLRKIADIVAGLGGVGTGSFVEKAGDTMTGPLEVAGAVITSAEDLISLTTTWNNAAVAFNGLRMDVTDTASAATSTFLDFSVGGTTRFSVQKDGNPFFIHQSADTTPITSTLRKRGAAGDETAAVGNGVTTVNFRFQGWTGSNYRSGATLSTVSTEAYSETGIGTRLDVNVAAIGSITASTVMSVASTGVNLATGKTLSVAGTQIATARITGWGAPTGTPTRTAFDTATVTLPQLAERVKALIDDLRTHGLIGN